MVQNVYMECSNPKLVAGVCVCFYILFISSRQCLHFPFSIDSQVCDPHRITELALEQKAKDIYSVIFVLNKI